MRSRKVLINAIAEFVPYIILAVLGLVKASMITRALGLQVNGYYTLINTIISYFFLAESGFTAAVAFHLYKPFADEDRDSIRNLYTGAMKIFRYIGIGILTLVLIAALFIFLNPNIFRISNVYLGSFILTFIVISTAYLIPSFGRSHIYDAIFSSSQNQFVYSSIFNGFKIVSDLLIIFLIMKFPYMPTIAFIILGVKLMEELTVVFVGKKLFPWIKKSSHADLSPAKTTKDLLWQHFGAVIVNSVDILVIGIIMGPAPVSVYEAYLYIPRFLGEIFGRINAVVGHSLGNLFASKDRKRALPVSLEYITANIVFAVAVALTFAIGARSFILPWRGNLPELVIRYLAVMAFAFNLFVTIIYYPLVYLVSSNGLFKESKYFIFVSAAINIILSVLAGIVLQGDFKYMGIVYATSISYFASIMLRIRLINQRIFPQLNSQFLVKRYAKYILVFFIFLIAVYPIERFIFNLHLGIFPLMLLLIVIFAVTLSLSITIMYVMSRSSMQRIFSRIQPLIKRILKRRE